MIPPLPIAKRGRDSSTVAIVHDVSMVSLRDGRLLIGTLNLANQMTLNAESH